MPYNLYILKMFKWFLSIFDWPVAHTERLIGNRANGVSIICINSTIAFNWTPRTETDSTSHLLFHYLDVNGNGKSDTDFREERQKHIRFVNLIERQRVNDCRSICDKMWPKLLDLSADECRGMLRRSGMNSYQEYFSDVLCVRTLLFISRN